MIDETAVKLAARLCAIEFLICELFSVHYLRIPAKTVHQRHDALLAAMAKRGVSGVDPVTSDLLSAEAETALRDLTRLIELHVRKPRAKGAI